MATMTIVKTAELSGDALDWAVATCMSVEMDERNYPIWFNDDGPNAQRAVFNPQANWAQGGPIIEREFIRVIAPTIKGVHWVARIKQNLPSNMNGWFEKTGPTPLVAAMRCFVASKLGDNVEVPSELL